MWPPCSGRGRQKSPVPCSRGGRQEPPSAPVEDFFQHTSAPVEDFFQHTFGFREKDLGYEAVRDSFLLVEDGNGTIFSRRNDRAFQAGVFDLHSLASLREAARSCAGGGPLRVRHVATEGALRDHADPANAGALFQVASQFNCLEFTSSKSTPELGITGYIHDETQGPACAIACSPATVFRNYMVPVAAGRGEVQQGQRAQAQLNTLSEVEEMLGNNNQLDAEGRGCYFWMRNGYVCSDPERLSKLRARLDELGDSGRDALRAAVKVGLGLGSEVTFSDFVPFHGLVPMPAGPGEPHTVSQVFSAAVNVRTHDTTPEDWEPFARLLLEATYEAALWAGVKNRHWAAMRAKASQAPVPPGSNRVWLTLVGGGVFGNRSEWIVDAINRALRVLDEGAPPEGWGLEVAVAHFREVAPGIRKFVYAGAPSLGSIPEWTCAACTCPNSALTETCRVCQTRRAAGQE